MINFDLELYWPYKQEREHVNWLTIEEKIPYLKNKSFCFQIDNWGNRFAIFTIKFNIRPYQDHAGFEFEFEFLGLSFQLSFYDHRHWNNEEGRWMTEEEMEKEADLYINQNVS
jgi:hypothetical protein